MSVFDTRLKKAYPCLLAGVVIAALLAAIHIGSSQHPPSGGKELISKEPVRLLLVSSAVRNAEVLSDSATENIMVQQYNPSDTTIEELLNRIRISLESRKAESIAFAVHDFGEAKFYLTGSQTISLGSILASDVQQHFWRELGSFMAPESRIDIFACNLARTERGKLLLASIESLAGAQVCASTNDTGNPASGGDWVLEQGNVDLVSSYFDITSLKAFPGLLMSEVKKITAYDATAGDYFGSSVSISGNYAIVGAYGNDDGGGSSGSAYIFYRDQGGAGNWGVRRKLRAFDEAAGDYFGRAVDISGSYAVVGAYGDDDGGSSSGSAYIFYRNQGGTDAWGFQKKLIAYDDWTNDYYGQSVAISGSYVLIGAWADDPKGSSSGSAYVYYKDEGAPNSWGLQKKLIPIDGDAYDYFGLAVDIYGSYIVVGAYGNDDGGSASGSAYIFYKNQGGTNNWGEQKKLTASDDAASDYFGRAVAISGSYALIGAYGDDDNGSASGSAYIFYRNEGGTNNWGQQEKLKANDGAADDNFGYALNLSGYYAVINAWGDDVNGSKSGSAYVFYKNQGGTDNWGQVEKILPSDGAADDYFGYRAIGISGYTVIAGAYADDDNGSQSGSAYIFDFRPFIGNPTVTDVTTTGATLGATVLDEGLSAVLERGVVWSQTEDPTTITNEGKATATGTVGTFTVEATGLALNTEYHFRGYARNSYGTSYTEDTVFSTGAASVPTITDPSATNITDKSATLGANVTSDGGSPIIQRGIVWSTTANPTVTTNEGIAIVGGTLGTFTANAGGLASGATYHFRGYAINAIGTAYTADATFETAVKRGKLRVVIKPRWAKKADAMWRVVPVGPSPAAPSPWYKHGKGLKLTPGVYRVEFMPAPGWVHPPVEVGIVSKKKLKLKAFFLPYMVTGSSDYDGDGDSDIAIYRPASTSWMVRNQFTRNYGVQGAWPVPGDYDGDGKAELAWWSPFSKVWNIQGGSTYTNFGEEGDIPLPMDYNGDGKTDAAVYSASSGQWTFKMSSPVGPAGKKKRSPTVTTVFGGGYYEVPVPGDYDGNGKAEIAIYNVNTGEWHLKEGNKFFSFGDIGDVPVQADYDGDGDTDIAVANMTLGEWKVKEQFTQFVNTKRDRIPVPGDYDGDGKAEIAYYRPSAGIWYFLDGPKVRYGQKLDLPLVRGN